MGWFFLTEYNDFSEPHIPFGVVDWTNPFVFPAQLLGAVGSLDESLLRVPDLIDELGASKDDREWVENKLSDVLEDNEVNIGGDNRWSFESRVSIASRMQRRHLITVKGFAQSLKRVSEKYIFDIPIKYF
jgi:hypothetical protein